VASGSIYILLMWTNKCLHSCCVPMSDQFDKALPNLLDFDLLIPGRGGCLFLSCWCEIGEEDDNGKMWDVLRIIRSASCQNGIIGC
jgi:hypothetical protein